MAAFFNAGKERSMHGFVAQAPAGKVNEYGYCGGWWRELVEVRTCELLTEDQLLDSRIEFDNSRRNLRMKPLEEIQI